MEKPKPPSRYLRPCGHPSDWTLDLTDMNGVVNSYCLGCMIKKLGLKPVDQYIIQNGKLVKIERRKLR